jgi:hypothetical protein
VRRFFSRTGTLEQVADLTVELLQPLWSRPSKTGALLESNLAIHFILLEKSKGQNIESFKGEFA